MEELFGFASSCAGLAGSLAGLAFGLSLASGFHAIFLRSLAQGSFSPLSGFQLVFRWLFISVSYEDLIPYLSLCFILFSAGFQLVLQACLALFDLIYFLHLIKKRKSSQSACISLAFHFCFL